ncbi:MAG: energy-coupling factor ABC transporter permease, partial [Bryobacteraceae bacterium]
MRSSEMHIPDGFLSAPMWGGLWVLSAPAVVAATRRAQRDLDESKVPMMGVLGAFVFAAQMVNFPLGAGTSGHLFGGTLLAAALGPAPAIVVMTAILSLQALIFQDGGLLALGANLFNMALAGTLAGYWPWRALAGGRHARLGLFAGGFCAVSVCAFLCLAELSLSGVHFGSAAMSLALGVFLVNAILEGLITVAVAASLEAIRPGWLKAPARAGQPVLWLLLGFAAVLASAGFLVASTHPDGLEHLARVTGLASREHQFFKAPLANYEIALPVSAWIRKAIGGLSGLLLTAA